MHLLRVQGNYMISVQVVYATLEKQKIIDMKIDYHTTVCQAIVQSAILQEFSEIDLNKNKVGIYGELVALDRIVSENDRIEIYRPLKTDPMQARRLRAQKKK